MTTVTVVQPSAGQPMLLPPGVGAVAPMPHAVPESVTPYRLYDPQMAGGTGVIVVSECHTRRYLIHICNIIIIIMHAWL